MSAGAAVDTVGRVLFDSPRSLDFLERDALESQTGRSAREFGDVVIKELVDNGLDAAEAAGVAPEITVTTEVVPRGLHDALRVSVGDNGPGMSDETITRILDFAVTTSDKAAFRSPTRGAMGNAWMTLFGIAHVGVGLPVVIESCGVQHEISVSPDPVEDVKIVHERYDVDDDGNPIRTVGTSVTITLPLYWKVDVEAWLANFAMINPHAHRAGAGVVRRGTDRVEGLPTARAEGVAGQAGRTQHAHRPGPDHVHRGGVGRGRRHRQGHPPTRCGRRTRPGLRA